MDRARVLNPNPNFNLERLGVTQIDEHKREFKLKPYPQTPINCESVDLCTGWVTQKIFHIEELSQNPNPNLDPKLQELQKSWRWYERKDWGELILAQAIVDGERTIVPYLKLPPAKTRWCTIVRVQDDVVQHIKCEMGEIKHKVFDNQ